jgi:hypothetical protein
VYQSQGDHDLAIADFNEFLRLNPAGSTGFYARGNSYREKGNLIAPLPTTAKRSASTRASPSPTTTVASPTA